MKSATRTQLQARQRRDSFTLVELIVVIAIIAVLSALVAGAIMHVTIAARNNVSKTTVTKVASALNKQTDLIITDAMSSRNSQPADPNLYAVAQQWAQGPDTTNIPKRTKIIYAKLRLRQLFPMTFYEALNPLPGYGIAPNPSYKSTLVAAGITAPDPTRLPDKYEASVCLLMALTRANSGAALDVDNLGTTAVATHPDYGNLKYVVDGFGEPVSFYRWPALNPTLNPPDPPDLVNNPNCWQADKQDPMDSEGLLSNPSWVTTNGATQFQQYCHPLAAQKSHKLQMVVVSPGADLKLGIVPVLAGQVNLMQFDGSTDRNDNVYSYGK